jgi:L-rhamnose isomerase
MLRALLLALLAPIERLKLFETHGDFTSRLALMEEAKSLPFGAVWDYYCEQNNAPVGESWLGEVKAYEKNVLSNRR